MTTLGRYTFTYLIKLFNNTNKNGNNGGQYLRSDGTFVPYNEITSDDIVRSAIETAQMLFPDSETPILPHNFYKPEIWESFKAACINIFTTPDWATSETWCIIGFDIFSITIIILGLKIFFSPHKFNFLYTFFTPTPKPKPVVIQEEILTTTAIIMGANIAKHEIPAPFNSIFTLRDLTRLATERIFRKTGRIDSLCWPQIKYEQQQLIDRKIIQIRSERPPSNSLAHEMGILVSEIDIPRPPQEWSDRRWNSYFRAFSSGYWWEIIF